MSQDNCQYFKQFKHFPYIVVREAPYNIMNFLGSSVDFCLQNLLSWLKGNFSQSFVDMIIKKVIYCY